MTKFEKKRRLVNSDVFAAVVDVPPNMGVFRAWRLFLSNRNHNEKLLLFFSSSPAISFI